MSDIPSDPPTDAGSPTPAEPAAVPVVFHNSQADPSFAGDVNMNTPMTPVPRPGDSAPSSSSTVVDAKSNNIAARNTADSASPDVALSGTSDRGDNQPRHKISYSACNQFKALFIKNAITQQRQYGTNICQLAFPIVLIVFLYVIQILVTNIIHNELGAYSDVVLNPPLEPAWFRRHADPCVPASMASYSADPFSSRFFAAGDAAALGTMPNLTTLAPGTGVLGAMTLTAAGVSTLPGYNLQSGSRDFSTASSSFSIDLCRDGNFLGTNPEAYVMPGPTTEAAQRSIDEHIVSVWRNPLADYLGGWSFRALDLAAGKLDFGVYYNKTFTDGQDVPAILSALTNGVYRTLRNSLVESSFFSFLGTKDYPRDREANDLDMISLAGPYMYLYMFQLLLPVFMSNAVAEKETKLREIVRMMGLKTHIYWIVSYIFNYVLYLCIMFVIIIMSVIFGFRLMMDNSFGTYFLLFFIWGHVMVALAWWFSAFFSSSSTATVVGYLYVFGTGILSMTLLSQTFESPDTTRSTMIAVQICPSFVLYRGLIALKNGVAYDMPGLSFSMVSESWVPLAECYLVMFIEWVVLMLLAMYCELVVPTEFGVPKHPLFFLREGSYLHGLCCKSQGDKTFDMDDIAKSQHISVHLDEANLNRGDGSYDLPEDHPFPDDVARARKEALESNAPIRIVNLVKTYPARDGGTFRAVNNFSLAVKKAECVGLMGPNGSGKSSTINTLSGYQVATAGTAFIAGVDINQDMDAVHMMMGICPQENVIWNSLTAGEHLTFYGRLKGLSGDALENDIIEKLEQVQLLEVRHKKAGEYSGGMKRRLCVAISLIGSPKIILLDEPTTGLDIGAKRSLWSVIKKVKNSASVLMVTHSIEEATECCDRLCVMEQGQAVTIDTLARLEERYVNSYKLTFSIDDYSRQPEIEAFVHENLSPNAVLTAFLGGVAMFEISKKDVSISQVFAKVSAAKKRLGVTDWGVSNTTLEEAIIRMQSEKDLDAQQK